MDGLPKQVRQAGENAERLIQQMQGEEQPEGSQVDDAAKPEEGQAGNATEATPSAQSDDTRRERIDYKAKYLVLQGKYNAEVPRLHADVKELRGKIAELEQALEKAKSTEVPETSVQDSDEAIQTLREEYGDEFAAAIEGLIDRKARKLVEPLQGKVDATYAEHEQSKRQAETNTRSREFSDAVNDLVPDWENIDKLPEFHEYLAELGSDGRSRQEALIEAANRFDAAGAARIFTAFKRTNAYQRVGARATANTKLAAQQVPDMSGRGQAPATGKVWTRQDVTAFYRDLALGKIAPDRAKQLERDIEDAYKTGRVR